jgi:hypothetical protein
MVIGKRRGSESMLIKVGNDLYRILDLTGNKRAHPGADAQYPHGDAS